MPESLMPRLSFLSSGPGRGRLKLLLGGVVVVCLIAIALFGVPLASPFTIAAVSFTPNTFNPLTANPGFELNDNTWYIYGPGPGAASIITGTSSGGSRSLFIHDPGQSIGVVYNNNDTKLLPASINSSASFGFDLLFKGNDVPQGTGSIWITLFISWRLDMTKLVPLTIVLGNFSLYTQSTLDNVTVPGGILMLRGVRAVNQWSNYQLQMGTPRVKSLIASYMSRNFSVSITNDDPLYLVGVLIQADNADAYFDNVGLFNVVASTATATLGKATLLPANLLGFSASVNGLAVNASDSAGLTTDSVSFLMDLPLAYNASYQIRIQTGWGTSIRNVLLTQTSLPTWV
jgi:hypothetical protein